MRRVRLVVTVAGAAAAIVLASGLVAAKPVSLEYQVLNGGRLSSWDSDNDDGGCELSGYAGVSDGWIGPEGDDLMDDAFDGGAVFGIEGVGYSDPDGIGNKVGDSLASGPRTMSGLRVSRVDRALPKSPTLRTLMTLRNNGNTPQTVEITWDANLGSDGSEEVRRSASGDAVYALGDRWVISSDDPTTPGDPVLTHVLFGKGKVRSKTTEIVNQPEGTGCFTVRSMVRVPRKQTRYLLFFIEMNRTHNASFNSARKFNKRGLNKSLLRGIRPAIRGDILNWKL